MSAESWKKAELSFEFPELRVGIGYADKYIAFMVSGTIPLVSHTADFPFGRRALPVARSPGGGAHIVVSSLPTSIQSGV